MNLSAILSRDPVTVGAGASLDQAMDLMDERDVRHLVVVGDGRPVGVISDRDLLEVTGWLSPRQREVIEAPTGNVGDFMHAPAVTVEEDEVLPRILGHFVQGRIGCLPVLRGEELVGIVTEVDVFEAYATACTRGRIAPSDDPPVSEHMTMGVATVSADTTGDAVADLLRERGMRHLPVTDGERLVGIVSDRDVRRESGRGQLEGSPVREWMSANPITARPDEKLSSAARVLATSRISALPVVDGGSVVGILSGVDVLVPCASRLGTLDG